MDILNKWIGGLLLGFVLLGVVSKAQAIAVVVAPKNTFEVSYTTTITTVTAISSSTSLSQFNPGAVFQILLSTGASGDYFQMYDSTAATNVATCGAVAGLTGSATLLGPRFYFSSTSNNSVVRLDPPLEFFNGLVVCVSSTADQASFSYDLGRGLSGQ